MSSNTELEYKLVGVVELISKEVCKSLGYKIKEPHFEYPFLVYSKDGKLDEGILFFEDDSNPPKFRYTPSHLIQEVYSISVAKGIYPELFL